MTEAGDTQFTEGDRARLVALVRERSFRTGTFKLASGRESNLYFNLKPTMMLPEGAYLMARGLLAIAAPLRPQFLGGLEMGAVPLLGAVAALSHVAGQPVPTFFVRKQPKDHGTKLGVEGLADGETLSGAHVIVIDDVTTTGGSTIKTIEAARADGAIVEHAISVLDREEGASENFAAIGVNLHSVLTASLFV